ncbi:hypothetical protein H4Q26_011374 [Puccinia striiformis f. sp. tritici PST-130]|nr:hypothetical protein H4Q26_011374 [Puccinia striiformis f. sp. tritici PST-130]
MATVIKKRSSTPEQFTQPARVANGPEPIHPADVTSSSSLEEAARLRFKRQSVAVPALLHTSPPLKSDVVSDCCVRTILKVAVTRVEPTMLLFFNEYGRKQSIIRGNQPQILV